MKEHPILFSAPMIKAILSGTKTQTRRVVKFHKGHIALGMTNEDESKLWTQACQAQDGSWIFWSPTNPANVEFTKKAYKNGGYVCPYGQVGDQLWVRETWAYAEDNKTIYRASETDLSHWEEVIIGTWQPSIFMPRYRSRITLEITGIRVERLQEITEADAQSEGVKRLDLSPDTLPDVPPPFNSVHPMTSIYVEAYQNLWDSINGKKHPWTSSPWVWVIDFKRLGVT